MSAIIFVCHDNSSIKSVIHYNHHIIFVGDKEISEEYINYPKLIIARNLKNNIEDEKKLLTFTAWYAISKNDLFLDYKYLCILEYDVQLKETFEEEINKQLTDKVNLSFIKSGIYQFVHDIKMNLIHEFLIKNGVDINVDSLSVWGSSTNQCVHRDVLNDFVEWYHPSYLYFKEHDLQKLPYYHERLFMIFLKIKNINIIYNLDVLNHFQCNSHRTL